MTTTEYTNLSTLDWVSYPQVGEKYYHYKGGLYEVISMATHSETNEVMVVYKSILFGSVYVRPLSMWFEIITSNGVKISRFFKYEPTTK